MNTLRGTLGQVPWLMIFLLCATLGLAPFTPEPHVWQKLNMLVSGELTQTIDIFDMVLHAVPWILLGAKLGLRA